jgi:hypothetical protein
MRGQLTLEFMLVMAATLALTAMLAADVLAERASVEGKAGEAWSILRAEAGARAVEAALHGGWDVQQAAAGPGYRIESGRLHIPEAGKMIEIGGAFIAERDEPV